MQDDQFRVMCDHFEMRTELNLITLLGTYLGT